MCDLMSEESLESGVDFALSVGKLLWQLVTDHYPSFYAEYLLYLLLT